ncbi:MAG: peptidase [Gammaproteobacteria bacterium]|nr:peptidase [Gammaproteobacteria bacterium]
MLAFVLNLTSIDSSKAFFTSEREVERQARLEWLRMKRSLPRPENPRVQSFVQCIANNLIAVLEEPYASMDWEVVVFDDDATNAFAMPGGKIGVFTGIFKVADTPDALAAVIGHEIAHLTESHVIERARNQSRNDMLVILGNAATGLGDYIQTGTTLLLSLPFDRGQESEADKVGLNYMSKAGYDPRASIYLWKNMEEHADGAPPEFLSTHPSGDTRMNDLVKSMTPALINYNEAQNQNKTTNCL